MKADVVFEVCNMPTTEEERKKYGWGEHVEEVHWLIHYTIMRDEHDRYVGQTSVTKLAYFNFNSDAILFRSYFDELKTKAKNG